MKKIEVIIRPSKLEELKEALLLINIEGLTVSQVMGCGKQKGWKEYYRGTEVSLNMLSKVKLEMVVCKDKLEKVIDTIVKASRTGEVGDGKIFISDISDVIRIRTGERGVDALL